MRQCRRFKRDMDYSDAVVAISGYVREAFQDSPPTPEVRGTGVGYYSFAVSLVGALAREYGWSADSILDMPLKAVFQFVKEIQRNANPNAILFNPSDKVRSEWMRHVNKRN